MSLSLKTAGAAGCAGLLAALGACTPPPQPAERVRPVFVQPVQNETGFRERYFSGSVQPRVESEIAFRAAGKVVQRRVEVGQPVRAGQALGRVDAADYRLAVDAAAAQLRAAEVDATQAASDAARFERLLADGSVGGADRERQQARADAAAARVEQARRQLELGQSRVAHTVLSAPFAGIVTALRFELGQVVVEGQPVLTLARPGELEAVIDVPETLAPRLGEQVATLVASDGGGPAAEPVLMRLRELAPSAATRTRTYRARYAFERADLAPALHLGSSVTLRLTEARQEPGAELPSSALLATDGQPTVWRVDETSGRLVRQPVRIRSQGADRVRVEGLEDGDLVVTVGAQKLDDQLRVRPVRRELDEDEAGERAM